MVPGMFKVGGDYSDIAAQSVKNFNYIQEKRKAADNAFDKYIETQSKTVDPNAVRPVDREAFDTMYKDWINYGIKNKKRIVSGDPAAKMESDAMLRGLSRFVDDSKTELKKELVQLPEVWKSGKVVRVKGIEATEAASRPMLIKDPTTGKLIPNPQRKSLDFTEPIWNAKTPNVSEIVNKIGTGKKRIKIEGVPLQNDPNTVEGRDRLNRYKTLRPIREEYTPQSIKEIGDLTAEYALSDESIKNGFDFEYENIKSQPEFDALNNAYKRYYGKDNNIFDGLSLAKAKGVLSAEKSGDMYEEEIDDTPRIMKKRESERAASEAKADRRAAARGGKGTPMPTTNVFDVISTTYSGGKIEKGSVLDANGKPVNGVITLTSGEVPAQLAVPMKSLGIEVGRTNLVKVKDGKIVSIKPGRAGEIDRSMILVGQQKFDTERKGEGYRWDGGNEAVDANDPFGVFKTNQ